MRARIWAGLDSRGELDGSQSPGRDVTALARPLGPLPHEGHSEGGQPATLGRGETPYFLKKNDSDRSQKPSFSCRFPRILLRHNGSSY